MPRFERNILKYWLKGKKFRKTSEIMEGLCFVISVMGLDMSQTGKEDVYL
jgi:hypothetical protein